MPTFSMGWMRLDGSVVGVGFTNAHPSWKGRLQKDMENATVISPDGDPQMFVMMNDIEDPRKFAMRVLRTLSTDVELTQDIVEALGSGE